MRNILILLAFNLCAYVIAVADEPTEPNDANPAAANVADANVAVDVAVANLTVVNEAEAEALVSYVVQLTEYRLTSPAEPTATVEELVALLTSPSGSLTSPSDSRLTSENENRVVQVESVRFSILSGHESMVQFGRQVSLMTGSISTRGVTTRDVRSVEVGTLVRAIAEPQDGKVLLTLDYTASRLEGESSAEPPPEISKTQISTAQIVELGKPVLIGGTTADKTSYTLATVTQ